MTEPTMVRVYDEVVLKEVRGAKQSLDSAQERYDEALAKLEPLTREKLRELQKQQSQEASDAEKGG